MAYLYAMNKKTDIYGKWMFVLHIIISLLFNVLYVVAFHLANTLTIYAIGILNMTIMVYNIIYVRKIIYTLVNEKNKWENAATYDSLTSILNRGIFIQNLKKEVGRAQRYNIPLSYIMFDLDHFKDINDTFGHPTGDVVLSKMCDSIKNVIRTSDYFGRLGGEEFGIILPETNIVNALQMAERIRKTIEELYVQDGVKVTASIGLTTLKPDDNPDTLYERADRASYESKAERNKVSIA